MNARATALVALLLVITVGCARSWEPANAQEVAPTERTLAGQLLLPKGLGSRGVEIQVTLAAAGGEPRQVWVLFDEQGHFVHSFRGSLDSLKVTAGIGRDVYRIESDDRLHVGPAGRIDVGVIDLRKQLTAHRLIVRAADAAPSGDVRVGMWYGPPPVGPNGEPVSLGSRQFPPVALGSELEWLLPHDARSIYFLVERPSRSGRDTEWRGGHQRLFGPFTSAEIPAELIMD